MMKKVLFRSISGSLPVHFSSLPVIILISEQIKTNNLYQQLVLSNPNDEMANEQMNVLYKTEVGFQISFSDWPRDHPITGINLKTMISFVDHGNSDNANTLSDVSLLMGEF